MQGRRSLPRNPEGGIVGEGAADPFILDLDSLPTVVAAQGTFWPTYLRARDAGRLFGVSGTTVRRWCREGEVDHLIVNSHYFVKTASLQKWAQERLVKARAESRAGKRRHHEGTIYLGSAADV